MTIRLFVVTILVLILIPPAYAATEPALVAGQPSIVISAKDVEALLAACQSARNRCTSPSTRSENIEVGLYGRYTYVVFIPEVAGNKLYMLITPGGAREVPLPSDQRAKLPVIIPGIVLEQFVAVVKFADRTDDLSQLNWFVASGYYASLDLGAASLAVSFVPQAKWLHTPTPGIQCLSGCGDGRLTYYLKVTGSTFSIRASRVI